MRLHSVDVLIIVAYLLGITFFGLPYSEPMLLKLAYSY